MSVGPLQIVIILLIVAVLFAPRIPGLLDGLRRGVERLDPEVAAQQDREAEERALVEARRPTWFERLGQAASRLVARLRARLGRR
jgi:Sec-independent protein translocase protein TatA